MEAMLEKSATEARANENAGRTEKKEENRSHSGSNHLEQTERRNEDKAPEATPKPEAALSRGSRRKNLLQGSTLTGVAPKEFTSR